MAIRWIPAAALGACLAMTFASDAAPSQGESPTAVCRGLMARIVFNDYDGAHLVQMCTSGLSVSAGVVTLNVYDNKADGIFHNAFEPVP